MVAHVEGRAVGRAVHGVVGGLQLPVTTLLLSMGVGAVLSRGLGRSYGDSSLPASSDDKVVSTRLANRIVSFDEDTGIMVGEAGFCLADLNRLFLPRQWFTPVTPGTKFVTLGGMVAAGLSGPSRAASWRAVVHCDGSPGWGLLREMSRNSCWASMSWPSSRRAI